MNASDRRFLELGREYRDRLDKRFQVVRGQHGPTLLTRAAEQLVDSDEPLPSLSQMTMKRVFQLSEVQRPGHRYEPATTAEVKELASAVIGYCEWFYGVRREVDDAVVETKHEAGLNDSRSRIEDIAKRFERGW